MKVMGCYGFIQVALRFRVEFHASLALIRSQGGGVVPQ